MAIQLRRGIASDIVPAEILQGELVYYTDTGRLAIGNGNGGLNVIQTQLSPVADQQVQFKGYVTDLDGLYVGGAYKTQKGTGTPVTYPPGTTDYNGWVEVLRYLPSGYPTGIIVQRRTDTLGQTWVRISTQAQPTTAAHWSTWTAAVADGSITLAKLDSALKNTINNAVITGSVTNLDALETPGIYYMAGTISGTMPPGENNGAVIVFRGGSNIPYQFWVGKQSYIRKNIGGGTSGWDAWLGGVSNGSITMQKLADDVLESIDNKIDMYNLTILDDIESASIPSGLYRMTLTTTGTKPTGETSLATTLLFVVQTNSTSGYQIWLGKKCYSRSKAGVMPWTAWSDYTVDDGSITMPKLATAVQNAINGKLPYKSITGNIDNLYTSADYGAYYQGGGESGTYPPGETPWQGILFVFNSGGGWAGQVWIGKGCYYRINQSTSAANWTAWSTGVPDGTITMAKLAAELQTIINGKADAANTYTKQQADNRFANAVIASKSGNPAALNDVQAGTQFKALSVRGVTTESGTGDKSPDNPYALSGISNPTVTVNGTDYATTTSTLYSLPNGVEDTLDLVSGVETHKVGVKVLNGTETITLTQNTVTDRFQYSPSPAKIANIGVCSHFPMVTNLNDVVENTYKVNTSNSDNTIFFIMPAGVYTVNTFKSWLAAQYSAETPVTVLYQLATPTTTQRPAQTIPAASPNSTVTSSAGNLTVQYNQDIAGALALKANKTQEALITPTLINGFTVHTSPCGYYKDDMSRVTMTGRLTGSSGVIAFALPEGYRPAANKIFYGRSANAANYCAVNSNGNMVFNNSTPDGWFSLDGISFVAGR